MDNTRVIDSFLSLVGCDRIFFFMKTGRDAAPTVDLSNCDRI